MGSSSYGWEDRSKDIEVPDLSPPKADDPGTSRKHLLGFTKKKKYLKTVCRSLGSSGLDTWGRPKWRKELGSQNLMSLGSDQKAGEDSKVQVHYQVYFKRRIKKRDKWKEESNKERFNDTHTPSSSPPRQQLCFRVLQQVIRKWYDKDR